MSARSIVDSMLKKTKRSRGDASVAYSFANSLTESLSYGLGAYRDEKSEEIRNLQKRNTSHPWDKSFPGTSYAPSDSSGTSNWLKSLMPSKSGKSLTVKHGIDGQAINDSLMFPRVAIQMPEYIIRCFQILNDMHTMICTQSRCDDDAITVLARQLLCILWLSKY